MFEMIDTNKRKTFIIVFLFVALLTAIIATIGYYSGVEPYVIVPLAVIISIVSSIGTYYFSDSIVLAISSARPADEREYKYLHDNLQGLCIAAGISTIPRLYIIDDTAPNAFATGRNPEHSVICVTTGLLQKLDTYELEGVLAHELAHIKNYDILLSTVVTVLVGIATLLSDWFLRGFFRSRRRESDRDSRNDGGIGAILALIGIVLLIISPFIAQLMKLALSRNREYLADATAIEFTRNPEGLANALIKISQDAEPLEAANKATANMYIVNPLKGEEFSGWLAGLYSTHPPIQDRVNEIRNIH
jgi:heat shock protein HtpX